MSCGYCKKKKCEGTKQAIKNPASGSLMVETCPVCGDLAPGGKCKNKMCGKGEAVPLGDYAASKRASVGKPGTEILERWNNRVLKNRWQEMGEAGAEAYLARFGRGIMPPKCIDLALMAEQQGYPDVAMGFWKKAYRLEIGQNPNSGNDAGTTASAPVTTLPTIEGLPEQLQPGRITTMQAIDPPPGADRETYINDPDYWGQPKRDGKRQVVVAAPGQQFYQARTTSLHPAPSPEIQQAMAEAVEQFGPFVLDGEIYYLDVNGGEHRTLGQATKVNERLGRGDVQTQARYAVFVALFADGRDLTGCPESERIAAGEKIGKWLARRAPASFEAVPIARTKKEKAALAARQQAEGREGEVWVRKGCPYTGGKTGTGSPPIVRTKYIQERDVVIMSLSNTPVEGRPFGAIEVGQYVDGKLVSMGMVGTGFDAEEMADLARRHAENPGQVVVTIGSQGLTENDQVWQGRFISFRDDKPASECLRE